MKETGTSCVTGVLKCNALSSPNVEMATTGPVVGSPGAVAIHSSRSFTNVTTYPSIGTNNSSVPSLLEAVAASTVTSASSITSLGTTFVCLVVKKDFAAVP